MQQNKKNGSYRNSKQINIGFNGQCNVTNNMLMIENQLVWSEKLNKWALFVFLKNILLGCENCELIAMSS